MNDMGHGRDERECFGADPGLNQPGGPDEDEAAKPVLEEEVLTGGGRALGSRRGAGGDEHDHGLRKKAAFLEAGHQRADLTIESRERRDAPRGQGARSR